jgi:hypothetical protein
MGYDVDGPFGLIWRNTCGGIGTAHTRVSHSGSMAHLFDLVMMNDHIRVYLSSEKCVSSYQRASSRLSFIVSSKTHIEDTLD